MKEIDRTLEFKDFMVKTFNASYYIPQHEELMRYKRKITKNFGLNEKSKIDIHIFTFEKSEVQYKIVVEYNYKYICIETRSKFKEENEVIPKIIFDTFNLLITKQNK